MNYSDYLALIPSSFVDFYQQSRRKPPQDLPNNPRGFGRNGNPFEFSCQSALMPIFEYIASQCETVTEFGLREGYSTAAFIMGLSRNKKPIKRLTSVDFVRQGIVAHFAKWSDNHELGAEWIFLEQTVLDPAKVIEETDYLHIDDFHTYKQVARELEIHGPRAKKFLSFHDTYSQGETSLDDPSQEGINRAITEYTSQTGWELVYSVDYNHGLQIYAKR